MGFFLEKFFLEKHIRSSFDVQSIPGLLFEYCLVSLSKAGQMSFELYPNELLLCAFIK
jgi:hypothetical protein